MRSASKRKPRDAAPRHDLRRHFVAAMEAEFAQYGHRAITKLRQRNPERFLRLLAELAGDKTQTDTSPGDGFEKLLEIISDGRGHELAKSLA